MDTEDVKTEAAAPATRHRRHGTHTDPGTRDGPAAVVDAAGPCFPN
ncbi:hypothetical protein Ae505Ps2_5004 [Pseudonocardia sp. Ae505_Ps2]|nr:hypothetical protein Ae505Ps2_5004 [Pseudonocardia sp. Ae505_Ps2]